ncbi:replication-relaxation family protein [Alicyclobacillus fastidiosus]|uniref:Replication-relaxation family protein n=1 Tax=Alicyclobacillus fastidiosus TaxID=392011 RepID=A0ABV5AHF3_9BACL|nr:replication-relaxation family protein [Alicyclobacillus fastidiosus]WEH09197.1 replication-relaxation family protein [Alicyclobacillus fastidiosus]
MILNWANGPYTDREKLIGTIYDSGVIRRSDLMFLLEWKRSKTDSHLLKLRQQDMLLTSRDHHSETVYMLSESGVRAGHQLVGFDGKAVAMENQISHQLGVNDILLRYIRAHGREGVRWYSTREASDELWNLRKKQGNNDADIRKTYIRPDAAIRIPGKGIFWVEYDNATESSRQIRKKHGLYVTNLLATKDPRVNRVVWVTPTIERARWLQQRWDEFEENEVEMLFFVAGEETSFLAEERIKDQQTV